MYSSIYSDLLLFIDSEYRYMATAKIPRPRYPSVKALASFRLRSSERDFLYGYC